MDEDPQNHFPFTKQQIDVLKGQIATFKLLSSNMPIPPALQQLVFGQDQTAYSVISKIIAISNAVGAASPEQALSSQPSLPLPITMPTIPPSVLKEQRAKIILFRKQQRIQMLEALSTAELTADQKLRASIELKALKLADLQHRMRMDIIQRFKKASEIEPIADPAAFLRPKRLSVKETRLTQKLERQQRFDQPRFASSSASLPLQSLKNAQSTPSFGKCSEKTCEILIHAKEFFNACRSASAQFTAKVTRPISTFHVTFEREEQRRLEKLAKDRIKALKADDEEAYFKLIDQQKDTRLTHILGQTDSFLDSLKKRVLQQRADMTISAVPDAISESSTPLPVEEDGDYYSVAHYVKEVVTEQPSILIGGKLKDYQLKGLQWMISLYNNKLNGILADEMGLGKTIQTISLISYLMENKGQNGPFLIVVPLSTLSNWSLEFEKWAPSIVKVEYKGSPQARKNAQAQARPGKFHVMLTTYEYIIKDRYFLSKTKWLYLIVDEGHRMKNAQSKLSLMLSQHYSTRYRIILTGTPLQNSLPELWSLLNFVLPKIFNSSKTFDEWFNAPFANTTGEKIELNEEEQLLLIRRLHKVLRPFLLRRLKKDVESELPDKVETVIRCPMSALQQSLYNSVQRSSRKSIGDTQTSVGVGGIRRLNNTIMQLRKICNHPFVFDEVEHVLNPLKLNNELLWRVCGKFELLSKLLPKFQATNHRILIFFQMTHIMTIMEDFLVMLGYPYLRLDGSTKSEERSELLAKFNDPNSPYFVFLLSTRAGGLGLNLQSADTVIIYDSDWNPHQDLQAQDRAHRIGQTKEVRILRLVTVASVEEYILERALFKLNIDGKVIQAGKFDQKSTNEEREMMLRALLETREEPGSEGSGEARDSAASCTYNDEELNEMLARNENELEIFNRIDLEIKAADEARARSRGLAQALPRLMQKEELPAVYLASEQEAECLEAEPLGERRRSKPLGALIQDDNTDEDDEAWLNRLESADQSDETQDSPLSAPAAKRYKSTQFSIMEQLQHVQSEDGRLLIWPFMHLPSAAEYPDYYRVIKHPVSFEQLLGKDYAGPEHLQADLCGLFDNALRYNAEGSQIWQDAAYLKNMVVVWQGE